MVGLQERKQLYLTFKRHQAVQRARFRNGGAPQKTTGAAAAPAEEAGEGATAPSPATVSVERGKAEGPRVASADDSQAADAHAAIGKQGSSKAGSPLPPGGKGAVARVAPAQAAGQPGNCSPASVLTQEQKVSGCIRSDVHSQLVTVFRKTVSQPVMAYWCQRMVTLILCTVTPASRFAGLSGFRQGGTYMQIRQGRSEAKWL